MRRLTQPAATSAERRHSLALQKATLRAKSGQQAEKMMTARL
jgi:hypothetical protein